MARANAEQPNMGLTNWKDAPSGKIYPFDVVVAKNYLSDNELAQLQRLVSAYLDMAEDMASRQIPMTMADWESRLNRFLAATDREILQDAGKVATEIARSFALSEFEKYRVKQDLNYEVLLICYLKRQQGNITFARFCTFLRKINRLQVKKSPAFTGLRIIK